MASSFILFLLPALVFGKFTIDIDLRGDEPLVDVRGEFSGAVEDNAREVFQITDEELIKAVTKYGNGTAPVKVYVKKNDELKTLYEKHGFYDVVRHVKPDLDIRTSKRCANREELHSDHADMDISSDWKRGGNLSVDIDYDVYIGLDKDKLTFKTSRGQKLSEKKGYTFGKTVDRVSKCIVNITVQFESVLEGDIVAQYSSQFNGHYFWAYDLAKLQAETNLTEKYITEETIDIEYYIITL